MVTGIPTFAKFIDMPPPIVPAPITPIDLKGLVSISGPTPGIFATCL